MNQIVAFDFESHDVRVVIGQDGEPRFVAADLLSTLSLDRKALERLDDDEKGVSSIHTPGGQQEMTVVNESGLFNLVLGSRKPEAKRFKRWVTHEVLPSIRKTGAYAAPGSIAALPARSPKPFTVHSTWRTPAFIAARELATASPKSLWQ